MTLVGTKVTIRDEALPRFAGSDTAAWFVTGFTQRGPVGPRAIHSLAEFATVYGPKVSYSVLYDALDVFFRVGGALAIVSRVEGAGSAASDAQLYGPDGTTTADESLIVSAKGTGGYSSGYTVEVVESATQAAYKLIISDDDGNEIERSPWLRSQADATDWGHDAYEVNIELGAYVGNPIEQTVTLTGGNDKHTTATDDDWAAALDKFTTDYGPGQVSAPGRSTPETHQSLAEHAQTRNRVALADLDDINTPATLAGAAQLVRESAFARSLAFFAPWAKAPGVAAGSTRTVPYSAVQAGLIARSEGLGYTSNVPAAGANGIPPYITGLSQEPWSDADREFLYGEGINTAILKFGQVRTYGYRTVVDPEVDPEWLELGGARVVMAIASLCDAIAEDYVLSEIDGTRKKIGEFGGRLAAVCLNYYTAGALFGETAEDAFFVDVGPSVNTDETIQQGKLLARIELASSPAAERVEIEITKVS